MTNCPNEVRVSAASSVAKRPLPADAAFPDLTPRRVVGIASPLAGAYAGILGARMVLLMSPDIGGALGASADEASWLITAYAMAELLVVPVAVYLALAFSMRRVMIIATAGFTVVSALSALADSLETLLVLRVANGLTAGCFAPLSFMMVLRTFRDRGRHEGLAALSFAVISPIATAGMRGGIVLEHADWRLLFWGQMLLGAGVLGMAVLDIPRSSPDPALIYNLDRRGYWAFIIGFPGLMLVLTQGERLFWLESPLIVGSAIVAAVALLLFVTVELRTPRPAQ